ncbi:uncharacterized protein LOC142358183 [Convolutriloba macropyga]|uniref:uncharacterized protein LOC142358183 n=1 Tax=Convolutriloba macropyga TaxID=536237 RepID=UPI003F5201EA
MINAANQDPYAWTEDHDFLFGKQEAEIVSQYTRAGSSSLRANDRNLHEAKSRDRNHSVHFNDSSSEADMKVKKKKKSSSKTKSNHRPLSVDERTSGVFLRKSISGPGGSKSAAMR